MYRYVVINRGPNDIVFQLAKPMAGPIVENNVYGIVLVTPRTLIIDGTLGYHQESAATYGRNLFETLEEAEAECEKRLQKYIRKVVGNFEKVSADNHSFITNYLDGKLKRV